MASYLTRRLPLLSSGVGGGRWYRSQSQSQSQSQYPVKVGIVEFLRGIGGGVEAHAAKIEAEVGHLPKLLETRTLRLKKLGIPCNHRKLILSYAHKYRLGLWRPLNSKASA